MSIITKNSTIPNLLSIDSSGDNCTIAIQFYNNNKKIIQSIALGTDNKQSASILSKLDVLLNSPELLDMGFISIQDSIDGLILSNGPGRFTGLRIAASVIQGLAYSFNKPVVLINSLQLLAQQFLQATLDNLDLDQDTLNQTTIWVCQKAYNNTYYQNQFIIDNNIVYNKNTENKTTVSKLELLDLYNKNTHTLNNFYLIGTGWQDLSVPTDYSDLSADAKYIFSLANPEYAAGNLVEYHGALPVYQVNPYQK